MDGAWWPRSRDLVRELPSLIAALDLRFGRIGRVTVNGSLWPHVPRRIAVAGRAIHVGWFTAEQDAHEICVLGRYTGRWDLLVIPPDFAVAEAARLMAAAAVSSNTRSASTLIAASAAFSKASAEQHDRETTWESEGGTCFGARPTVESTRSVAGNGWSP
jgi:hypothetical protein